MIDADVSWRRSGGITGSFKDIQHNIRCIYPVNIYFLKVNNRNNRKRREICSKLTLARYLIFLLITLSMPLFAERVSNNMEDKNIFIILKFQLRISTGRKNRSIFVTMVTCYSQCHKKLAKIF